MAMPAVTTPPGELMYRCIGFAVSSASRKSSCATISDASPSSICYARHPLLDVRQGREGRTYAAVEHDDALAKQTREDVVAALAASLSGALLV